MFGKFHIARIGALALMGGIDTAEGIFDHQFTKFNNELQNLNLKEHFTNACSFLLEHWKVEAALVALSGCTGAAIYIGKPWQWIQKAEIAEMAAGKERIEPSEAAKLETDGNACAPPPSNDSITENDRATWTQYNSDLESLYQILITIQTGMSKETMNSIQAVMTAMEDLSYWGKQQLLLGDEDPEILEIGCWDDENVKQLVDGDEQLQIYLAKFGMKINVYENPAQKA